jgi:hypothetical protein
LLTAPSSMGVIAILPQLCRLVCCSKCSLKGEKTRDRYPINSKQLVSKQYGAAWITRVLRHGGAIAADDEVGSMRTDRSDVEGMLSDLLILTLDYKTGGAHASSAPQKVVVKFSPSDFKTRLTTDMFNLGRNEYNIYTRLHKSLSAILRIPKLHFAEMNFTSNNMCLILELVDDAEFMNQTNAVDPSLEDILLIVQALARIHSRWCGEKWRGADVAFLDTTAIFVGVLGTVANGHWKKVRSLSGGASTGWTFKLPADMVELWPLLVRNTDELLRHFSRSTAVCPNPTIGVVHGDPRLDNWFFYTSKDKVRHVGLLDWQLAGRHSVLCDLTWFATNSLSVELQSKHEEALLHAYFAELRSHGVAVQRELWEEEYNLSFCLTLLKDVIAAGGTDTTIPAHTFKANRFLEGICAAWTRRGVGETFRRFCAGELISQQPRPAINSPIPISARPSNAKAGAWVEADRALDAPAAKPAPKAQYSIDSVSPF